MDATGNCWVITAASAKADEHGLLELHLTVTRPPGSTPPLLAEQRCYRIHPDAAPAVMDALMNVAGAAIPGRTEA
jgi:hypothetical protein